MKEKPIVFSTDMVKAIIEGRKSQTRRVIKVNKIYPEIYFSSFRYNHKTDKIRALFTDHPVKRPFPDFVLGYDCPFGQVGSLLWVKESWRPDYSEDDIYYKDNTSTRHIGNKWFLIDYHRGNWPKRQNWRSPFFMPRWASRITLEIENIRVERLQDITETDAISEGIKGGATHKDFWVGAFQDLWNSIHKKEHRWQDNPFVWVITFKRVK